MLQSPSLSHRAKWWLAIWIGFAAVLVSRASEQEVLHNADNWMEEDRHKNVEFLKPHKTGVLKKGKIGTFTMRMEAGKTYFLLVEGDSNAKDLAFAVFAPDGKPIGAEGGDYDVDRIDTSPFECASFKAPATADYEVRILMMACKGPEAWWVCLRELKLDAE